MRKHTWEEYLRERPHRFCEKQEKWSEYLRKASPPQKLLADDDWRTRAQRDVDRLLETIELRRLAEVTQVATPNLGPVLHNRLTHTFEVAQVARRIAERMIAFFPDESKFYGLDPEVAYAAALAHDLGHPPFGHIAEATLKRLVREAGINEGFEGNAQSFRIVTKLATRHEGFGLDLSRATLNAILKYPRLQLEKGITQHEKYGAYKSEKKQFDFARKFFPLGSDFRSIEAEIMDWADDVAYSIYDVEDYYRAGRIPLHLLCLQDGENVVRIKFLQSAHAKLNKKRTAKGETPYELDELDESLKLMSRIFLIREAFDGSKNHLILLHRFTKSLVHLFVEAIEPLTNSEAKFIVSIKRINRLQCELLKQMVWYFVIEHPALITLQFGQTKIIENLFNLFLEDCKPNEKEVSTLLITPSLFKDVYEQAKTDGEGEAHVRIAADCVASLTDLQAFELHQRLTGQSLGTVLDLM